VSALAALIESDLATLNKGLGELDVGIIGL
jgi:hypothetical protein